MLHIFTLYYGNKFTKDNVNNLYKQIKKYYKGEFTFYCYTDKKEKFANGIRRIHLIREKNPNVREAWYKIDFFMKSFVKYSKDDTCIVMDIDQEIVNDPTPLFDIEVPKTSQWRQTIEEFLHPTDGYAIEASYVLGGWPYKRKNAA